jgi:four helix bundle protein
MLFIKNNIITKIPSSEKFVLIDQIKRSSRSVCNNISEGYGRYHFQENIQFCRIARGSLFETLDHAIIALDEGYILEEDLKELRVIHNKTLLILNGYIKYLMGQKDK